MKGTSDLLLLRIKVTTRAAQSAIAGVRNGEVLIRTTAAAVDGAANADVMQQLAKAFGVAKSRVQLVRGVTSRHKHVRIIAPRRRPAWLDEIAATQAPI